MDDNTISDNELEEELEKTQNANKVNKHIFSIIRKEKESLESRDRRIYR